MDIDEVYSKIGEFGSFQRKLTFYFCAQQIWSAFHMIHLVFIGANPDVFICDGTHKNFSDYVENDCEELLFDDRKFTSIVTEWNLIGMLSYKVGFAQSMFMAGVLVGAVIFGNLSDRKGRYKPLFICVAGMTLFTFLSSFSPSYQNYILLRFLAGIFNGGMILVGFVLCSELVGSSKRAFVGVLFSISFAIGIVIFSCIAALITKWRWLSITVSLPGIFIIASLFEVPESPRWLISKHRLDDATYILKNISFKNNQKLSDIELKGISQKSHESHGILDIFSHAVLLKQTLIQTYAWFVCSAVYYGLTMSAGNLGSNKFLSVILSAVVELPAYGLCLCLIDRLGRKISFYGTLLIGGLSCLSILITSPEQENIKVGFALFGKLTVSASFAIAYIYSAELYPTVIRNNALGICSMAARVGGIVAPSIVPLHNVYPSLEFLVFGLLAFSAGLLCLYLPETLGRALPETIEDMISKSVKNDISKTEDKFKIMKSVKI